MTTPTTTRHTPRPAASYPEQGRELETPDTTSRDPIGTVGMDSEVHTAEPSAEELEYRGWFGDAVDWAKDKVTDVADVVIDKAKDYAKDKIDDAVGVLGGAVGGWFGGPTGAVAGQQAGKFVGGKLGGYLFRGTDGAPMVLDAQTVRTIDQMRSEQSQIEAISREVLELTTPVIADAMYTEFQDRRSRNLEGPADDEAIERFWGDLATKLSTTVLTDFFPQAVKKVSQNLGAFAGIRSMQTIDPLMVDAETAIRFGVPVLGTVLASVQASVPDLYAFIEQGSRPTSPRDAAISYNDLLSGARLHGGDRIAVLEPTRAADPDTTELVLELPPQKGWWKGLRLSDERGTSLLDLSVDGINRIDRGGVASTTLTQPGSVVQFLKADANELGQVAYRMSTEGLDQARGQCLHFYWYAG